MCIAPARACPTQPGTNEPAPAACEGCERPEAPATVMLSLPYGATSASSSRPASRTHSIRQIRAFRSACRPPRTPMLARPPAPQCRVTRRPGAPPHNLNRSIIASQLVDLSNDLGNVFGNIEQSRPAAHDRDDSAREPGGRSSQPSHDVSEVRIDTTYAECCRVHRRDRVDERC